MNTDDTLPISHEPQEGNDTHSREEEVTQEVGWGIDKGQVRKNNEDSLVAVTLNQANQDEQQSIGVYAVADGMGGHDAGEVASKLAVRTAMRKLMSDLTQTEEAMPDNYQQWLKSAVDMANQLVHNKARESELKMGTTLVMAVVVGREVHIANVGDSRAYVISSRGIRQITHDHSFVQNLIDQGTIKPDEALKHPYRNILTQALGSQEQVEPDTFSETLQDDESLLLCSDGLWEMLSEDRIRDIVMNAATPEAACQALIDATNAAGGKDNIAAVVVRLNITPDEAKNQ
jgi:serine/threonine protein phosphatase PrpC